MILDFPGDLICPLPGDMKRGQAIGDDEELAGGEPKGSDSRSSQGISENPLTVPNLDVGGEPLHQLIKVSGFLGEINPSCRQFPESFFKRILRDADLDNPLKPGFRSDPAPDRIHRSEAALTGMFGRGYNAWVSTGPELKVAPTQALVRS